jgi:hypothetical protein
MNANSNCCKGQVMLNINLNILQYIYQDRYCTVTSKITNIYILLVKLQTFKIFQLGITLSMQIHCKSGTGTKSHLTHVV